MKTMQYILGALLACTVALSNALCADVPQPPSSTPGKIAKTVTVDGLQALLEDYGFNPKPMKNADGEVTGYTLEFRSGTWTLRPWVTWTRDKSTIFFFAGVLDLDGKPVPAEVLMELYKEAASIFPTNFSVTAFTNYTSLTMRLGLPVEGLTPGALNMQLVQFGEQIKRMVIARDRGFADAKAKAERKVPNVKLIDVPRVDRAEPGQDGPAPL